MPNISRAPTTLPIRSAISAAKLAKARIPVFRMASVRPLRQLKNTSAFILERVAHYKTGKLEAARTYVQVEYERPVQGARSKADMDL